MVAPVVARAAPGIVTTKVLPALMMVGAAATVGTVIRSQLSKTSNTMDRYFAPYNTPQSEASRAKVFDGAVEDPRTNVFNILSW